MSAAKPTVRVVAGELVLDDPAAFATVQVIGKHNCRATLDYQIDRVVHFETRMKVLNKSTDDVVIVLINVDEALGSAVANALMPGVNWQEIRDRGEIPFARGLAERGGIQELLDKVDEAAAAKLRIGKGVVVVVMDHGAVEVFSNPTWVGL
jgi:hypothetical protein